MKKVWLPQLLFIATLLSSAQATAEMIQLSSPHDVKTTADRFVSIATGKGMTIFNRIDHAAGAKKVGQSSAPTEVIIFGNPKVGTALMNCGRSIAIDLPLKVLLHQDDQGKTWLSYTSADELAQRHQLEECDAVVGKVTKALAGLTNAAIQP